MKICDSFTAFICPEYFDPVPKHTDGMLIFYNLKSQKKQYYNVLPNLELV